MRRLRPPLIAALDPGLVALGCDPPLTDTGAWVGASRRAFARRGSTWVPPTGTGSASRPASRGPASVAYAWVAEVPDPSGKDMLATSSIP